MNCSIFKKWLGDPEQSDSEMMQDARTHRTQCAFCDKLFKIDARLELDLQEGLRPASVPQRLLQKIETNLRDAPPRRPAASMLWRKLVPALAVAAALLLIIDPSAPKFGSLKEIGALAIERHLTGMDMAFKTDTVTDTQTWFAERGHRIAIPNLGKYGVKLVGGRACLLGDRKVAYLFCKKNKKAVSLFIIASDALNFDIEGIGTYYFCDRNCEVTIWKLQNQVCVMVV